MQITYLSSPISSQYGGGEKFIGDFTAEIEAEHEFIGSSKSVHDLFQSKGYKSTLTSGLFEPVSPRNLLLIPISILVGLFQFFRFCDTFKGSDWIISPTSHCETFFVIPWIKLFFNKKVMFMVHAKTPKVFGIFPFNVILSKCWGNSPVTFVSNSQKELWLKSGCISPNQIVIYNGVKIKEFSTKKIKGLDLKNLNVDKALVGKLPLVEKWKLGLVPSVVSPRHNGLARSDWGYKNDGLKNIDNQIKIGFIGRLHREKGCDVLIDALESIKSKTQIQVVIAGDGPEKEKLIRLLKSKQISPNISVEFIGFQADTKSFYESIDLLVFPSRSEGFSLVLLEAWERGIPVLTSNIKPFLEAKQFQSQVEQELVFELDNNHDLAQKINYFLQNASIYLSQENKLQLHQTIEQNFGTQTMVKNYKALLDS